MAQAKEPGLGSSRTFFRTRPGPMWAKPLLARPSAQCLPGRVFQFSEALGTFSVYFCQSNLVSFSIHRLSRLYCFFTDHFLVETVDEWVPFTKTTNFDEKLADFFDARAGPGHGPGFLSDPAWLGMARRLHHGSAVLLTQLAKSGTARLVPAIKSDVNISVVEQTAT